MREMDAHALVGTLVRGKYRIDRLLGDGGMAVVFAATHRNGRKVAIKMLRPELTLRTDIQQRFVREGRAANTVNHPGVVAVIDDDVTDDGAPFLVMELLAGQCVEDLWMNAGERLDTRLVLTIARDLCDVLAAAHRNGVVHRDLKPANLFLTHDGQLKVLDFGIASVLEATSARMTATGDVFGTPAFLPPEQACGRVSLIDGRTDLWAVGATMFALLSGHVVHEGETAQHIAILSATKEARPLADVMPSINPAVAAIVDRALRREREDRFQSAEEMRDALNRLLGTPAPSPKPAASDDAMATLFSKTDECLALTIPMDRSGETTALEPRAFSSQAPLPPRGKGGDWGKVVAPIAMALSGVMLTVFGLWRGATAQAATSAEPPPANTVVMPVEAFAPPPVEAYAPPPPVVVPPAAPSVPAAAAPKMPVRITPRAPVTKKAPTSPAPSSTNSACGVPYTTDAAGIVRWKTECL